MKRNILLAVLALCSAQIWALDAPTPTNPSDGIKNAYTRQTFMWNSVSDAGSYQIQVDTTTRFNSPLLRSETWSATSSSTFSVKMTDFYFRTHYYWRVRAISKTDEEVTSEWSEVWDMTTLSRPTLVSPNDLDETATYFPTQTLTWKNSRGCTSYTIEIDTVPTFDSPAKTRETWSHTATEDEERSCEVKNLYLGKMNYWRLKVYNKNDSSDWSETYRFHTLSKAKGKSPDGYTSAYTTQTFEWTYYKGLNNVIIELDTTVRFNSPALQTVKSSGSSQAYCNTTISNLYFGKTHYWRVRSYHQKDTTDWSDVLHFQTYNFCTLSTPKDSATNQIVTGKIWWKWNKGVSTYQVQMDTTSSFNSPSLINKMEGASSDDYAYYSYSELLFGQRYFWRVRECHNKDTSNWSEIRMFTTYRHCNLTKDPQDHATEVITSPQLNFNYTNSISNYQMQLDTTPLFNSALLQDHIESASSQTYAYHVYNDLLFGTTYYRRVRECHSKDTSDWSPVCCFTTIVRGAYSTNSNYASIANGATGIAIKPKLYYFYRSYIDSVEIQIDTTGQFDSPLFQSIRAEEASSQQYAYEYPKNQLLYGTTYYWRIRNSHSKDVSDWTFPRYFTTLCELPKPVLITPEDRTPVRIDSVVFVWHPCKHANGDATQYTLQLAWDGGFDSIYQQITVNDTTTWLSLSDEASLFWRVQGENSRGKSPWSEVRGINPAWTLPTPELMIPANEAGTYTRVAFKWHSVTNADTYLLQVCRSNKFDIKMAKDTAFADTAHNINQFWYGQDYYWRVRAVNKKENLISKWSEVRHFRTSDSVTLDYADDPDTTKKYYSTQTLRWFNHVGSTGYVLEIDTTEDFTSRGKRSWNVTGSTSTSDTETITQQVSQLYLGCFNYWRVRAVNKNDTSQWSEVRRFHTLGKAEANYPSDGLTNSYTKRNFGWKYFNGLDSALVQLDTVESFDSPAMRMVKSWAYNQDDAYTEILNMYFGKRYYWRVANFHRRDTTEWSDVRTFTTYNSCVLKYPSDSATNQYTTRELTFEYRGGVYGYTIEVDTTANFDSPMFARYYQKAYGEDWAHYTLYNLHFGTTYFWRVKENNNVDTTVWSKTRRFTTYDWGVHKSPSDGATGIAVQPKLTYEYSSWLQAYMLQVDTATSFDSPLLRDTTLYASSQTYAYWQINKDLLYGTTYYWRVADVNKKDTSNWSVAWAFTTTYQLPQSTLLSPNNQTTHYNENLVFFSWKPCEDATKYVFELSDDGQFRTYLHQETLTDTTTSLVPPSNSILYWRVQAINSKGRSPWSNVWGISTTQKPEPRPAIDSPAVYIPNSASETGTYSPVQTFRWQHLKGYTGYIIEIDTVETFTSSARTTYSYTISSSKTDTYIEKEISNLYLGCFNYWHVKGICKGDTSNWSVTHKFHTLSKAVAKSPSGQGVSTSPTLRWEYQKGFPKTIVEVDTTTSFSKPLYHSDRETPNSTWAYANLSELLFGVTYYWRVRNYHSKDTTEWSDVMSFSPRRSGELATSPEDGAKDIDINPYLYFTRHSDISYYQMQIDTTSNFNSDLLQTSAITEFDEKGPYRFKFDSLLYETTYYRRIKEFHSKDTSDWSSAWSFTTISQTPPSPPTGLNENGNENKVQKVLIDGRLYIIKDDKKYDATGFTDD